MESIYKKILFLFFLIKMKIVGCWVIFVFLFLFFALCLVFFFFFLMDLESFRFATPQIHNATMHCQQNKAFKDYCLVKYLQSGTGVAKGFVWGFCWLACCFLNIGQELALINAVLISCGAVTSSDISLSVMGYAIVHILFDLHVLRLADSRGAAAAEVTVRG